jgi:type IV pilus assembly protein PilE
MQTHRFNRGFTLIELMIAVSVAGILGSIAFPSFESQLQRARRTEALAAMLTIQLTQERWHANTGSYGTLAEIGASPGTANGRYLIEARDISAGGYQLIATESGPRSRDATCRTLRLHVVGMNVDQSSGPNLDTVNPAPVNRRCWNS